MLSMYPACFYKEAEGYSVVFPDLNNLATQVIPLRKPWRWQWTALQAIFTPASGMAKRFPHRLVRVPSTQSLCLGHLLPTSLFLNAFVNVVSVDVAEYAKQHFERSVKKTLSIPAWLNDAAMAQGINFSCVLQQALKEQLHMA